MNALQLLWLSGTTSVGESRHGFYIFEQLSNHYRSFDSLVFRNLECFVFSGQVLDKAWSFKICIYSALVLINAGLFNNGQFNSGSCLAVTEKKIHCTISSSYMPWILKQIAAIKNTRLKRCPEARHCFFKNTELYKKENKDDYIFLKY